MIEEQNVMQCHSPDSFPRLRTSSLNALARNLPPVEPSEGGYGILVLAPLDLHITSAEENLHVDGVTLVRVDATVRAVGAATGFL